MAAALEVSTLEAAEANHREATVALRRAETILSNLADPIEAAQDRLRTARNEYSNLRTIRAPEAVRDEALAPAGEEHGLPPLAGCQQIALRTAGRGRLLDGPN
jgi:multidrug resistance efflux pump